MQIRVKNKQIDITKAPFRGILAEIAREDGVSRQAVHQSAQNGNPKLLERIAEKVEERKDRAIMRQRLSVYDDLAEGKVDKKKGRTVRELIPSWS